MAFSTADLPFLKITKFSIWVVMFENQVQYNLDHHDQRREER